MNLFQEGNHIRTEDGVLHMGTDQNPVYDACAHLYREHGYKQGEVRIVQVVRTIPDILDYLDGVDSPLE